MQAHNGMNANRTNDLKRFACIEKSIRAPIHPSQFGGDAIECYLKPHNRMGTNVCDTMRVDEDREHRFHHFAFLLEPSLP